jgi:hypothetical protein
MFTERLIDGQKKFVCTSKSGRKYVGDTPEAAERKRLLAIIHAANREFEHGIVRDMCESMFGTQSFGSLTVSQLLELKAMVDASKRNVRDIDSLTTLEPKLTDSQRKRLIRLGLYVLGPVYGKDWFWAKCKKWIIRLHDAKRVDLDQLTNQEAWYLIRRMEKIEKRLLQTGEIMTDAEVEKI